MVASALNLGYHFLTDGPGVVVVDAVVLVVVVVATTGFRVIVGLFVTGFLVTGIRVGRSVGTFTAVGTFVGAGVTLKKSSHSTWLSNS